MTDGAVDRRGREAERAPLSADGLRTYLRCPRRYEFAHVHGFEGDDGTDGDATDARVTILRRAICAALERAANGSASAAEGAAGSERADGDPDLDPDREALEETALERLGSLWDEHDERFHSRVQRRHERQVLEATLRAYLERVGVEHAAGVSRLLEDVSAGGADAAADADAGADAASELVGPDLTLSSTVSLADIDDGATNAETDTDTDADAIAIESTVDYVYGDGSSVVGVRFVPSIRPLGLLRYRSDWERVAELFVDHFDPELETFEPGPVGALFETAVVLDGLRNLCDRLGLEDRTCRYVQIPLADRSGTSVNWVRETVETSLETVDLTDVYIDHLTYGRTHEHRNETVDSRLESVASRIVAGAFDPTDPPERWEQVADEACPRCEYTVCCGEYIAEEVRFDG